MKKLISITCTVCLLVLGFTINVFADTVSDNIPVIGITLNKTSDVLIVGETDTLEAEINPINATNKSVTWASSNPETAAVDASGKITAVNAGTAAITVTTTDGNKTAVCNVTVNAELVTGVTLNKTSDVLTVGETDTLIATVSPTNATNKSVTWVSSNPKAAAVDASGKITAISAGSAIITVTTTEGSKTAVCNVTVNTQPVSSITLNKTTDELVIGETDNLTATVNPINATNKSVTWVSSNPKAAAVDEWGRITAVSPGTAVITVTTKDGNKTATCRVTVKPVSVSYSAHVQNIGWQDNVSNGEIAGTTGKSLRLEALKINLVNAPAGAVIKYQTHVQNIGWQAVVSEGMTAGTSGLSLRAEAIKIWLQNFPDYSVQYRVHVEKIGWQPWTENGGIAGTEGRSLRMEAIEIRVVKTVNIQYQVHVEKIGWLDNVSNGTITGTGGQPLRIEAIKIKMLNAPESAYLNYQAHVQNIGWMDWTKEGAIAGTTGQSLRAEALKIKLYNMPGYSVQYQVFVQNLGWQSWVSDGQAAGTKGMSLRIEGIRIRIIENPDGSTTTEAAKPTSAILKSISNRLTSYLDSNQHIASVMSAAIAMHGGIKSNNCVYFSSEAMRRIGFKVPNYIGNTKYYVPYLKTLGLHKSSSRDLLSSGSICFTINDSKGYPTHTFLFLGWVDPDDHSLAYVIDNQAYTVHTRSMLNTGITDAFSFSFHS